MDLVIIDHNKFSKILTKAGDHTALAFKTIDETSLQRIEDWMPEVNRAVSAFSKQNSQTTASLMTLTMLESGPYRVLRQILAQVEQKRAALKETFYKLEKQKLRYLKHKAGLSTDDELKKQNHLLEMSKIESDIVDTNIHIEAALKELGAYMDRYKEVCKNNSIPEQWDEADFERAEIEHHIKSIFRNAVRDRMQGSHNMGTMEYMEQFGLNPITAYALVDNYIAEVKNKLGEGLGADINAHYNFFDRMYDLFKDEYQKAMKRIGLDHITQADWLMKENK
jgi:hypothetical protein